MVQAYKLWHNTLPHIPKLVKYSLGKKVDTLFTEVIELLLTASFTAREQKSVLVQRASMKLDILKFFLQVTWELKALNNKQIAELSQVLSEVGKMLGGWQKQLANKTPPA